MGTISFAMIPYDSSHVLGQFELGHSKPIHDNSVPLGHGLFMPIKDYFTASLRSGHSPFDLCNFEATS